MQLETSRLLLVPIDLRFEKDVYTNFTSDITSYMLPDTPQKLEDTKRFIQSSMQSRIDKKEFVYAICHKEDQRFIGCCGLHALQSDLPELGIWICKEEHGHKYGLEAIKGLLGLAKRLQYKEVAYPVDYRNIASAKIPQYFQAKKLPQQKIMYSQSGNKLYLDTYIINVCVCEV